MHELSSCLLDIKEFDSSIKKKKEFDYFKSVSQRSKCKISWLLFILSSLVRNPSRSHPPDALKFT